MVDVTDDRLNDFDHWLMRTPRAKTGQPCRRSTRRKYVQLTRKWIRQAQEQIGLARGPCEREDVGSIRPVGGEALGEAVADPAPARGRA